MLTSSEQTTEVRGVTPSMPGPHTNGLDEIEGAIRYKRYLFELLAPYCSGTVLEVGSGHGDLAARLAKDRVVMATDVDAGCLARLEERFAADPSVSVRHLDITHPTILDPQPDSVVAVNVLEHIEGDVEALRNLAVTTRKGGSIVLFVPAHQALFGPFDTAVGHFRRYSKKTLREGVEGAGLEVVELLSVNMLGAIAWWVAVRLGKRQRPRPWLVRIYDAILVPVVRIMEARIRPPFGQSLLCVARLPE